MSFSPPEKRNQHLSNSDIDLDAVRKVLKQHSVRLGVLFGSVVTGETHAHSDIDIVVEFEDSVTARDEILPLIADLSSALERNDIDLSVVHDMKPRVGVAAFSNGVLLIGSQERMELHRTRFERAVNAIKEKESLSLRERFDRVIEKIDATLEEKSDHNDVNTTCMS
jgi:predicted nucleotidyltransferase